MASKYDLDNTTTVHVGLGEIAPRVRPQSVETVNCLEMALQKLSLENLMLKHRLNDPSQGSMVLKNINARWGSIWPSSRSLRDRAVCTIRAARHHLRAPTGGCPAHMNIPALARPSSGPASPIELQAAPWPDHWLKHLSDWWL